MIKILLSTFILLATVATSMAQITGGGKEKSQTAKTKPTNEIFDNSGYITFVRSSATGSFGQEASSTTDLLAGIGDMDKGFGVNLGTQYYINSIDVLDGLKFGVDWTYLSWTYLMAYNSESIVDEASHFVGMKIGPTVSYNPIDKLIVDLKFTFQPTYIGISNSLQVPDGFGGFDTEYFLGAAFKTRTALGLYVRYKPFILGFESSWGTPTFSYENYSTETNLSTSRFDLVFGFGF